MRFLTGFEHFLQKTQYVRLQTFLTTKAYYTLPEFSRKQNTSVRKRQREGVAVLGHIALDLALTTRK